MSRHERSPSREGFEQKLKKLRLKIDLLPAEQRPRLYDLADAVEREHRRLRHSNKTAEPWR